MPGQNRRGELWYERVDTIRGVILFGIHLVYYYQNVKMCILECSDDDWPQGWFKCANNECTNASWVCNNETDCADGSDEADCSKLYPYSFSCQQKLYEKNEIEINLRCIVKC